VDYSAAAAGLVINAELRLTQTAAAAAAADGRLRL